MLGVRGGLPLAVLIGFRAVRAQDLLRASRTRLARTLIATTDQPPEAFRH